MGYVFDFNDAKAYEQWYNNIGNRFVVELENRLMLEMLKPMPKSTLLDIGCGAGSSLFPFLDMDIQLTGLDPSPYMLDIASEKLGNRVDLHRGVAEDLPFDDNFFDYTCMFITLEFVENPKKAIEEACRVTKDRIFFGILNRYAAWGMYLQIKCLFKDSIYKHARFFSIWELKHILKSILGHVPISWRTVCQLPMGSGESVDKIERSSLLKRFPFGTFAGVVVTPVPRFRTKLLSIARKSKQPEKATAGYAAWP